MSLFVLKAHTLISFALVATMVSVSLVPYVQIGHASLSEGNRANCGSGLEPSGSLVIDYNTVLWPDGSVHHPQRTCSDFIPLTINGYIEEATQSGSGWDHIDVQWYVPQPPQNQNGNYGGNLIALFDGIQDNVPNIFQPVLVWGCQFASIFGNCVQGGGFWWIAAEECCQNEHHTSAIQVNVGDLIDGQVGFFGEYGCSYGGYTVTVTDRSTGSSTSLSGCTSGGTLGISAAAEGSGINSCNQLPNQDQLNFFNIASSPTVNWGGKVQPSLSPYCTYNVTVASSSSVSLWWNVPPQCSGTANPTDGTWYFTVYFTSSCSGGTPPYSYNWHFNDCSGGTSSAQNPSYNYHYCSNYPPSPSVFQPTLTVTDSTGVGQVTIGQGYLPAITVYCTRYCPQSPSSS